MRRTGFLLGVVVVGTLMAAPQALAKPGRPFTGPTLPGIRSLQTAGFKAPLLVQLKRGTGSAVAEKTIRANGGRLLSTRLHIWLLQPDAARALLPDLIRRGVVSGVEPNQTAHAAHTFSFSDPLWQYEWWRGAVGAERVTAPGPGVPITVLDSGVDIGHPEFRGAPITLLNQQVLSDSSEDSHGTGVTSVAAAPANGVGIVGIYPGANVWAYDLRDLSTANVIAGIDAAIGRGRSVINMSFGSTEYSAMEEEEILIAFGTGSLLVAAAGNEFHEGNPVEYPASLNHVLTIAATDELNKPTEFSNSNDSVDLAAPGQDIVLATPFSFNPVGWELADGTSFSAPITAAAAAWVWSVRRNLDHTQLFDLLRFSAHDIWDEDFDPDTGFGLLDIPTALSDEAPKPDPHEPNDDIYMVKAKGLFSKADAPLTRPGHGSSRLDARLDYTEDPEDVYRVYVPAHRSVTIRVVGDDDVNLDMWRPGTRTVYAKGAELRRYLIGSSARKGTAPETMTVRNSNRTAGVIYADVFLGKDAANASYTLHVTTSRK